MGVTLAGDAAQVRVNETHIGNLYRWRVHGVDGDWSASAEKYRLTEDVGDAEFRFFLGQLEINATGSFDSATVADGKVHRETVHMKGSRIWVQRSVSNSQMVTGRKSARG